MEIANRFLKIALREGALHVERPDTDERLTLDWPAVAVCTTGREIRPETPLSEPTISDGRLTQCFEAEGLRFEVSVALSDSRWFFKRLNVHSSRKRPTPDYVEVDRQALPADNLRVRGYRPATVTTTQRAEEEGAGVVPGCGYPLVGDSRFIGLEHPAGFNRVEPCKGGETVRLRHHPVWNGPELGAVDAVFGWADDAEQALAEYVNTLRCNPGGEPLVAFCTFWTDPYIGDWEYGVSQGAFEQWFKAFAALGLKPDVFALDAGWNDRQSVFQAKPELNGDAGLAALERLSRKLGNGLSLWVSHNGAMGIAMERLRKLGVSVGEGPGAAYSAGKYGVLLDSRLTDALEKRFCELAGPLGARHFKIDWDNECATAPKFTRRYPTPHHVRQGSVDAMLRIAAAVKRVNPKIALRNGWWPSPWWLRGATHVWLTDSGDCEYCALPSRAQRDAASTHRDLMYYHALVRDGAVVPLDCFDNHEFPDAPRNPFPETPVSWTNAVWMSFLRGSNYVAYTLNPESLEDWQAESLRRTMAFCRGHSGRLFSGRGRMVGGHPGKGEVYGFLHPGKSEDWLVLRNPLPMPQRVSLEALIPAGRSANVTQFYPHFESLQPRSEIPLLAHEVKILALSARAKPAIERAFQVEAANGAFAYRYPASADVSARVRPLVDPLHRVDPLGCVSHGKSRGKEGAVYRWRLRAPARMRELEAQCRLPEGANVKAFVSRYDGELSEYAAPVTVIATGKPGHGEGRNREDLTPPMRFIAVSVPDGGEFQLRLIVNGPDSAADIEAAWLAGYEAPSREAVVRKRGPRGFADCPPPPHPLGFPRAVELPL